MNHEIDKLRHLYKISQSMHTLDLDKLLRLILEGVTRSIGFDRARLYLVDEQHNILKCKMAVGIEKDKIKNITLPIAERESIIGRVVVERKPYIIHDAINDPRVNLELKKRFNLKSFAAVPLIGKEKVLGVITADNLYSSRKIKDEQVEVLITFANQAGLAIENASMYERLKQSSKVLEEKLIQSSKLAALGQLSAGIAHELRNPLTSIKILINSLVGRIGPNESIKEDIEVIESEIERMNGIIKQFLDFSRPGYLCLSKTNINEIVKETLNLVAYELKDQNISITKSFDYELPIISADGERLKQVFLNIILNARQAMPEGGKLLVKTLREDNYAIISIKDTGKGIPEDIRHKLFEPFFTTREEGLGLGLPISKRIIDNHKGAIEINSALGKGTSAVVKLPIF
jgi:signal transduction histidine kinase